jgi:aminoglycoside/choline kinase family phosphotransferase
VVTGLSFPARPEQLAAEWLTEVLRDAGCLGTGRVTAIETEPISAGVGFVGQIVRIAPTYDRQEQAAPRTLIGKFPTSQDWGRQVAALYGLFSSEVRFYRHVAPAISLRTPRCYRHEINDEGTEFVLLLEDMWPSGRLGDQVPGCAQGDAELAMRKLAELHAAFWDNRALEELEWLSSLAELARRSFGEVYPQGWKPFVDTYGQMLSSEVRAAAPKLNERLLRLVDELEGRPSTLVHGDYRLDNFFFGNADSDYDLAVVDWQVTSRGFGSYDLAWFLGGNLEPEQRRRLERPLLELYCDSLAANGVAGYSFERCWEEYVKTMAAILGTVIANFASFDPTNERGVALFEMLLRRYSAAVTDLDSLAALP